MAQKRIVKNEKSGPERKDKADRRYITLPRENTNLPFSDGVLVGKTLYIAGRVGLDSATGQPPLSVDEEIRLMLDSFQQVLQEAGMATQDVVWVQVFCADLSLWDRFNSAYRGIFRKHYPSRTFIASQLVAGLRFEMNGIAVKNQKARLALDANPPRDLPGGVA